VARQTPVVLQELRKTEENQSHPSFPAADLLKWRGISYDGSAVYLPDPQFARSEVLRVFNHAQIYLFLGSAIITAGLVAAAFSFLGRRFNALLLWFAVFAILLVFDLK
jgi:hypothetical protein